MISSPSAFASLLVSASSENSFTVTSRCRNPAAWWTHDCAVAHRHFRRSQLHLKRHFSLQNFLEFKRSRALFRRVVSSAKRNHRSSLFTFLSGNFGSSNFYRQINRIIQSSRRSPSSHFINHNSASVVLAQALKLSTLWSSSTSSFEAPLILF